MSAALAALRGHPRHLVLAGLVVGLLNGPVGFELAAAAAALAAALAGNPKLALLAVLAVMGGAALADARVRTIDATALRPLVGRDLVARATALDRPRITASGARSVHVRLEHGPGRGERLRVRLRGRVRWPAVAPGARVVVRGRLAELARFEAFERRRGVHAALELRVAMPTGGRRGGVAGAVDRIRARAEDGLAAGLGSAEAGLLRGMVLGQDEAIAEPVRDRFRASGLAHLLAVSGQNVMLLAALALPLVSLLGLGHRARLAAVLLLIAVYVPLAGGGPSIQRAGVMGAAGLVAAMAGRPASRWYALLLAAAVTLAINPYAAAEPGWQLSFAAVVALLAWAPRLRDALRARRLPGAVADVGAITLAATAGTLPLLALHFEQVSLVSVPANLLAAPAVAPLMWLGMVAAAVGQVSAPAAALVNGLNLFCLGFIEWVAAVAAAVPHATVPAHAGLGAVVAAYAALALGVHVRRARAPLAVGVLLAAALAVALRPAAATPPASLAVSFLDVGQGDATLIQHGGSAVLVDTGPPDGPILDRLKRMGARRLDALVVTHAQADHEGGAAAVLANLPVGLLLDGGDGTRTAEHAALVAAAARHRVRRLPAVAGQVLRAGPIELRVLWPPPRVPGGPPPGTDPNQLAVVAHVRDGDFDLLLPADAESDVIAALTLPPVEALKVAHHGSADPGLAALLARLRPRVAAIEVGRHNRYGHPTAQALAALRAVPAVYRTDRDGTVRITVTGGRMRVVTAR